MAKKPNSDYWKKRFAALEESANIQGIQTYDEIEKQYMKAQRTIEGQITAWYGRFADNNNILMSEAKKMLTSKELAEFKWEVSEYIRYGEENVINGIWAKQLENASARYHISRLESLKIQTQQSLEVMFGNQFDSIDSAMRGIYSNGYYHTAYEIQKGFGVGWDIAGLDEKQISKVINKPWAADGKNFSERIWGNQQKLISEMHTELTQNIMLGKDPQKAINAIAKKMNTSKKNAGRLVMTEEAFFNSAAQKDCFNELDVEKYEIVATLDSHTSDMCREMDGKVFDMKEYEPGTTAPPFHVWCRSTTVPYFDDDYGIVGERAARDENGDTYYVPSDMKYDEWHKQHVENNPRYLAKEKAYKNRFSDKEQYEKYKEIYKSEMPKTFDKFQDLKYNDSEKWNELKLGKQETLNKMDFKDMKGLTEKLGDKETRLWYKYHDESIPNLLDTTKSIKEQAIQACNLRNTYRTQARDLMKDQVTREELDIKYPNKTFEELIQHKCNKYGLTEEEAYYDIVRSSQTTNKAFDKRAGLKE